MDDKSNSCSPATEVEHHRARGVFWYIGCLPFLLSIYVLSAGPAVWYYQGRAVPKAVGAFYEPLERFCDRAPTFGHFLEWYVHRVWARQPTASVSSTNAPPVAQ